MDILEIFLNPNVAYLLLWAGITLALLAILSPGTILLELGALVLLVGAGVTLLFLPVNYWALGLMALGVFFFIVSIRYPKMWLYLAMAIGLLVVGSIFLFRGDNWWDPAVNPFLALIVSGLSAVFFWIVTRKVLEAREVTPSHDLENLVGAVGETKTTIHRDGSVQIGSELWSAKSEEPIAKGARVLVMEIDGFTLVVKPVSEEK
jgi:membrane-bound serine protease (ClpP class)